MPVSPGGPLVNKTSFLPSDLTGVFAWWAAGNHGEFVETRNGPRGPLITRAKDLTGQGNDLVNYTGTLEAGYRVGVTLDAGQGGPWSTALPMISIDRFGDINSNGYQHYANVLYLQQPLVLSGPFAILDVLANSRTAGVRDYWGTTGEGIRITQGDPGTIELTIQGTAQNICTTLPNGPVILEIVRDASDVITVTANGTDVTAAALDPMAGDLVIPLLGWDGIHGGSHCDDYRFEAVVCDADPGATDLAAVRAYWASRWGITVS